MPWLITTFGPATGRFLLMLLAVRHHQMDAMAAIGVLTVAVATATGVRAASRARRSGSRNASSS